MQSNNSAITVDNSAFRRQVNNFFELGEQKYSKGGTIEMKEEGVGLILKGMKILQNWIDRETDPQMKQTLSQSYSARYNDLQTKISYLEKCKNKGAVTDQNGLQQVKKGSGGGGEGGGNGGGSADNKDDSEKSKFEQALSEAIVTEKPNVKWTDIAGLVNAKKAIQEAVILPIKFPDLFTGARIPWKGILLYGPPGTGKTFLAKACATEASGTFFSISSSDLISKYVGESEKLIKTLFKMARDKKPSIIFIDEIDSLCGARGEGENEASRRVKTEFLVQMEGVGHDDKGVLVLGATNLPWALDQAVRRRIYIPLPDYEARLFMIQHNLKNTPNNLQAQDYDQIAKRTEGYSGSDISILVRDAVMEPVRLLQSAKYFVQVQVDGNIKYQPIEEKMRQNYQNVQQKCLTDLTQDQVYIPPVSSPDVLGALQRSKPSVAQESLKDYEKFTKDFGQDG